MIKYIDFKYIILVHKIIVRYPLIRL